MARLKKQVGLTLEPAFLARVDEARGDVSRNRFIERALEEALGDPGRRDEAGGRASSPTAGAASPASPRVSSEPPSVPPGVEMAQRRVSGHVRPPIPKKGS